MREFRIERLTDLYCAENGLGRDRAVPSRGVLKSFLLQHYVSSGRYTY